MLRTVLLGRERPGADKGFETSASFSALSLSLSLLAADRTRSHEATKTRRFLGLRVLVASWLRVDAGLRRSACVGSG
jgi:hypothetical protein